MNTIEDRLREHYSRRAAQVAHRDICAEVIRRGRRLRARRRTQAGAAAVITLLAGLGIAQAARDAVGPTEDGLVLGAAVPAPERAAREAAIAAYVEKHSHFSWIDDPGGRIVCATQELGEQPRAGGGLRVFVWALCEARDGGVGSATSLPLVVDLDEVGQPNAVLAPGDGSAYAAGIKANFPRELWDDVLDQRIDNARLTRDLDARAKK